MTNLFFILICATLFSGVFSGVEVLQEISWQDQCFLSSMLRNHPTTWRRNTCNKVSPDGTQTLNLQHSSSEPSCPCWLRGPGICVNCQPDGDLMTWWSENKQRYQTSAHVARKLFPFHLSGSSWRRVIMWPRPKIAPATSLLTRSWTKWAQSLCAYFAYELFCLNYELALY